MAVSGGGEHVNGSSVRVKRLDALRDIQLTQSQNKSSYQTASKAAVEAHNMHVSYLIYGKVDASVRKNADHIGHEAAVEPSDALVPQYSQCAVHWTGILTSLAQDKPSFQHLQHTQHLTLHSTLHTGVCISFNLFLSGNPPFGTL